MKHILLLVCTLMLASLCHANIFYISVDYMDHLENGGLPSAFSKGAIIIELDSAKTRLILHNAVQMEPEYYTLRKGKFYYQEEEGPVLAGSMLMKEGNVYLTIKYVTGSRKFVPVSKILPAAKNIDDSEKLIDLLNGNGLPGVFNLLISLPDSSYEFKDLVFRKDGLIQINNETAGTRRLYTGIDCGSGIDLLELTINGQPHKFLVKRKPGSTTGFLLYRSPDKPCSKETESLGTLSKTIAK